MWWTYSTGYLSQQRRHRTVELPARIITLVVSAKVLTMILMLFSWLQMPPCESEIVLMRAMASRDDRNSTTTTSNRQRRSAEVVSLIFAQLEIRNINDEIAMLADASPQNLHFSVSEGGETTTLPSDLVPCASPHGLHKMTVQIKNLKASELHTQTHRPSYNHTLDPQVQKRLNR